MIAIFCLSLNLLILAAFWKYLTHLKICLF